MIGIDPVAADIDAVEKLRDYGVPVLAIHSPCLLITQRVWEPILGPSWSDQPRRRAGSVRTSSWFIPHSAGSATTPEASSAESGGWRRAPFSVENMYPWRTPGGELKAYVPGWDPTELDYDDLTLDLSRVDRQPAVD